MPRTHVSFRLTPEALKLLKRLAKKMGLSQAGVIETLVREKAGEGK